MSEQSFHYSEPVSAQDALIVCIFFAIVLHTLMILGVNFSTPIPDKISKSIAITLVTQESQKAPDKAEFLAQNNQIGAGEKRDKPAPNSQQIASSGTKPDKVAQKRTIQQVSSAFTEVLTQEVSEQTTQLNQQTPENIKADQPKKLSREALRKQIAELGAQIRYQKAGSDKNRIKFVNSVSAHKYLASQYIIDWQRKIEGMGNLNYPSVAKRPGFSGALTMDVGIRPDGSIYRLKIRKSSGYPALDSAAERIVRLSAPFPPLPKALLKELDVLVISRVWTFSDGSQLHTR